MAKCPTPDKAYYHDWGVARATLRHILEKWDDAPAVGSPRSYYRCRCRGWHLTSRPPGGERRAP